MRTIKAEPITCEAYAPYGTFYSMTEPSGYSLNGEIHRFFPDRMTESYVSRAAFSPILVKKPDVIKITQAEYHTTTPEMILPLNDDMIAEGHAGEDQFRDLASGAASGPCGRAAGDDHPAGVHLCQRLYGCRLSSERPVCY